MDEIACPVCSSREADPVGDKGGHRYLRCAACALIYAPDLPTPEQFAAAYGRYNPRPRWVGRKVMKLAPMIWAARLRRALRGGRGRMRALDIGSNTGYNTEAMRRLGCEGHGLETNAKAIAFAREEYPRCSFHELELVAFADQAEAEGLSFDFIYCSEVIEHVPDAHGFVEAMARISNPDTLLFLTTPDAGHWKVPDELMSWKEVIPVEHLRLYDKVNLAQLIEAHGFRYGFTTPVLRANQRHYCVRIGGEA